MTSAQLGYTVTLNMIEITINKPWGYTG